MQACKENIKLPFRREKNQGPKKGGVPRGRGGEVASPEQAGWRPQNNTTRLRV